VHRIALGQMRATRPTPRSAFGFQPFFHKGQPGERQRVPQRLPCELLKCRISVSRSGLLLTKAPARVLSSPDRKIGLQFEDAAMGKCRLSRINTLQDIAEELEAVRK
jgi:hypothetical protein